jgi:hypothetical protein
MVQNKKNSLKVIIYLNPEAEINVSALILLSWRQISCGIIGYKV